MSKILPFALSSEYSHGQKDTQVVLLEMVTRNAQQGSPIIQVQADVLCCHGNRKPTNQVSFSESLKIINGEERVEPNLNMHAMGCKLTHHSSAYMHPCTDVTLELTVSSPAAIMSTAFTAISSRPIFPEQIM